MWKDGQAGRQTDRQTERQTDKMEVILALRNFKYARKRGSKVSDTALLRTDMCYSRYEIKHALHNTYV